MLKMNNWFGRSCGGYECLEQYRYFQWRLLPAAYEAMGELWTLQQENLPIHTAGRTRCSLDGNKVHALDPPVRLYDFKFIE